jgi:hypothetical protein
MQAVLDFRPLCQATVRRAGDLLLLPDLRAVQML